ncbi:phospholipase D-like domain-containing protein [Nocardioides sp.]|uniref:phospholipase D-like domain-containing protein n=1 Tax=Nocardioides sp. TaxID=35761 RepID=UPI002627926B|nr:phospholipase D-like domain-containing protein [Nocardioides sp.]MDI6911366.1 phospholipase D-like domain-containing protein [Nocardioides sp.]
MRSRILALVGAVALGASLLAVPAQAGAGTSSAGAERTAARTGVTKQRWMPTTGGWFNDPWGDAEAKYRIERQIVAAINHARKGSYIRIALYSFDRVNVAKALINAHDRGVRVQVLHNDHQYTTAMKMLKHELGSNRSKKSWDYICKTGCRSEQGVLHDKIYLFEHTGGATDVVMTGSHNLTGNAVNHQFNDLLIKAEVPRLYDRLLDLFTELKRDRTAKPLFQHSDLGEFELWVMPHPRTTEQNDPIMNILRPIQCQGAQNGTGTGGRTKIRVSMHAWNGARGTYIARRLRHLYAQGCDVRVLWALGGAEMKRVIGMSTPRGTVPRHTDSYNTDCDELQQVDMYSHQKYLTVSGHYGEDRSASYVFTGSSNYTHSGLVGDEMILRAPGVHLVNQWNRNFDFIWNERSRPVGDSPGPTFAPTPPTCTTYRTGSSAAARRATTTDLSFSGRYWESD